MNSIIYSYAKMIDDNICTISQIPQKYRDEVRGYMESMDNDVNSNELVDDTTPKIYGAHYLYPITDIVDTSILGNGGSVSIEIANETIFSISELDSDPMPNAIKYEIIRVENVYGKFKTEPVVELTNTPTGFKIKLQGTPKNIAPDSTILRVDLRITSSNYENMRITLYIDAQ